MIAELPITPIISLASTFLVGLIALVTWIAKGIFTYQNKRIETLENREQTLLTSVVDSVENTSVNVKTTADFVVQLIDDLKYRERRRQEEQGEGGRKP